jgi:hypothetical protein
MLIFRPRKVHDKIEFTNDIPRRWKDDNVNSPVKNLDYYDNREHKEFSKLHKAVVNVVRLQILLLNSLL